MPTQPVSAAATFTDPHFREYTIFSGLDKPTTVRFASNGRAFVSREGRGHQDLRLGHGHDADDGRRHQRRRHELLGPRAAQHGPGPGLPHEAVPVRLLGVGRRDRGDPAALGRQLPDVARRAGVDDRRLRGQRAAGAPDDRHVDVPAPEPEAPPVGRLPAVPEPRRRSDGVRGGRPAVPRPRRRRELQRRGLRPARRDGAQPAEPVHARQPVRRPGHGHVTPGRDAGRGRRQRRGRRAPRQDVRTTGDPTPSAGRSSASIPPPGARIAGQPALVEQRRRTRDASSRRVPQPVPARVPAGDLRAVPGQRGQQHVGGDRPDHGARVRDPDDDPERRLAVLRGPAARRPAYSTLGTDAVRQTCTPRARRRWQAPFYTYSHKSYAASPRDRASTPTPAATTAPRPPASRSTAVRAAAPISYPSKYRDGLFFVDYDRDCLSFFPAGAGGGAVRGRDRGRGDGDRQPGRPDAGARRRPRRTWTTMAARSSASGTSSRRSPARPPRRSMRSRR